MRFDLETVCGLMVLASLSFLIVYLLNKYFSAEQPE
jgi:hypothetical protein